MTWSGKIFIAFLMICMLSMFGGEFSLADEDENKGGPNAPSSEITKPGEVEFEHSFEMEVWEKVYGDNGDPQGAGGRYIATAILFGLTVGILEGIEVGMEISLETEQFNSDEGSGHDEQSTETSDLQLKIEYGFLELDNGMSFAVEGKLGLPTNDTRSPSSYIAGLNYTWEISERFATELSWAYIHYDIHLEDDPVWSQEFSVGIWGAATESLLLITEFNGFYEKFEGSAGTPDNAWVVNPMLGVCYELEDVDLCVEATLPVEGLGANTPFSYTCEAMLVIGF